MNGAATIEDSDDWFSIDRIAPEVDVKASVIIPNYCAEATLRRAIDSARAQSLTDIEIILVDDASTDRSWDIITEAHRNDNRVRIVRHRCNRGKPIAMNRAISLARGRWVSVLDADDWFSPERMATLVEIGERWQFDLVADNQFFYDGPAERVTGTAWPVENTEWEMTSADYLTGSNAYDSFNLGMLKPVIRLDFMRRCNLDYEMKARHGQDFFHVLKFFLLGGRAVITNFPHYYYTQPFGAISRRWSHATRKRYDFQNAVEVNGQYLRFAEKFLPMDQFNRLRTRNERLQLLEFFCQAKEALRLGNWQKALSLLLRYPGILGYFCYRLYAGFLTHPPYFSNIQRIARRSRRNTAPRAKEIESSAQAAITEILPTSKRTDILYGFWIAAVRKKHGS